MNTVFEEATYDVVVVGGGFAGFWAAVAARRVLGSGRRVVLASAGTDLVIRPRLYEANPESLCVPLRPLLDMVGVDLVVASATVVDTGEVLLDDGRRLTGGAVVVAVGSRMVIPPILGVELAHSIDDIESALRFDAALAAVAHDPMVRVAVVGAGFTGIEVALEIPARLRAHGRADSLPAPSVVMVDQAGEVGVELGPGPRAVIVEALQRANVEVHVGASVAAVEPGGLRLDGRGVVAADVVLLCTGLHAQPLAATSGLAVDRFGRVQVDPHLGVPDRAGLFVAGDAAVADTGDGMPTLQSCQHAMPMGKVAGENAARHVLGLDQIVYSQPVYVTCLDLGDQGAVLTMGWDRSVVRTGDDAKAVKRHINTTAIYPPADGAEALLAHSIVG